MSNAALGLREIDFEKAIEAEMIGNGWIKGSPAAFDKNLALDTDTLLRFVQSSQSKQWEKFVSTYGADAENAFIRRIVKVISEFGLLHVLRNGFKDMGTKFSLCYFKPANDINPELADLYKKNIFNVTRQLKYSLKSENSIDIVLFLNGIPVVSMELKNQFTGQDKSNAIAQYKFDRATKDTLFQFKNRVFVHFAVDLLNVFMTTKLEGPNTFFLPFNQGSNGAGNSGDAGNPANPNGFAVDYLWNIVLTPDNLMNIIQNYLHIDKDKKSGKEKLIFPRYHQLDVVEKLTADVINKGAGQSYLIQHSAGSGKSNSIAWLAYHLSSLHDKSDEKIFDSIIVLTDRRVLDSQLQDTIYQFDHVNGTVAKIDKNSEQLKDAINNNTKIIISTLQKFPIIYKQLDAKGKKFAVILDEAHSSQTGSAATSVITGLSDAEMIKQTAKQDAKIEDAHENSEYGEIDKVLKSQGKHKNLSFFAFTATPKPKTLERFGTKQANGQFCAFHIYSMKQAISEGFILDVLANYTTYKTYYQINKKIDEDPQFDSQKGRQALAKYISLHPHNIAQKTEIMIEHFRNVTKKKIGGHAKAMVVTGSRATAVRYLQSFKEYIKVNRLSKEIDVLVAFSGEVKDGKVSYTEVGLNKVKESQLPEKFASDDFNILIVAEKYQTGFDQPLLHTMFVDKKLKDVKAVQTLSRLNRTTRGKEDTFVLDFVNTTEEIAEAFQPFYTATFLAKETDPNALYDLKTKMEEYKLYNEDDYKSFGLLFYGSSQTKSNLAKLTATLDPIIKKFWELPEKKQEEVRNIMDKFVRMHAFIIQITQLNDHELQCFSVFARALLKFMRREKGEAVTLEDKIELDSWKTELTSSDAIKLAEESDPMQPMGGNIGIKDKAEEPLSVIIQNFNDRFGTEFTSADKVLKEIKKSIMQDKNLQNATDKTAFNTLFKKRFDEVLSNNYEDLQISNAFLGQLFEDAAKLDFIKKNMQAAIYSDLKEMHKNEKSAK